MEEKQIRLLLVEDDKVDQMAFKRYVKKNNLPYDYTISGSVAEAKTILSSNIFDIIIADYMLGDGISFELFDDFKNIPTIITTGIGNEEIAVKAMRLGAYDYLTKDPNGNHLKTLPLIVSRTLKHKRNEDKLNNYHNQLEKMVEERTAKLESEILEHKYTEEKLRISENRFKDITHSMADWIWEVDKLGRCTYLSKKEIYGYSAEELIGKGPFNFMYLDEGMKIRERFLKIVLKAEPFVNLEIWITTKDGSIVCMLTNGVPILDENDELQGYRGVAKNITYQKNLETEKMEIEEKLNQAEKMESIGTLAGGIAHDFNNILAVILGNTEFVLSNLDQSNPFYEALIDSKDASIRARDLVKQILLFSRKTTIEKFPIDIAPFIKSSLKLLRASIPTSAKILQNISSEENIIMANSTHIAQILINLCSNAAYSMPNGGTISVNLDTINLTTDEIPKFSELKIGKYLRLKVSDNGTGMSQETISKMFDPYFTTKPVGSGTGLGLSIVYGLVKDHDGDITVDSKIDKGTTFNIYFPVIVEQKKIKRQESKIIPRGNERILFVDDEEMINKMNKRMLETLGYKVECKLNPLNALKVFKANPQNYDLIITDKTMPEMTGDLFSKSLLDIRPDIPIILCTGYSDEADNMKLISIGIKKVLLKPLNIKNIADTIRNVLDGKQV